jgi:flagellar hook assembly protein FlgD
VLIDEPANPPVMQFPKTFRLAQNYPNPFNPSTTIAFDISRDAGTTRPVSLIVYDIRGRRVRNLVDSELAPGTHTIHWDGLDDQGKPVASGIYFYTLKAGGEKFTRKMTILK